MKNFLKNYWAVLIPVIVLIIPVAYLLLRPAKNTQQQAILGMVDAEFIDVSASFPGRIENVFVQEGSTVTAGQPLARLKSSALATISDQISSAVNIAENQANLAQKNTSPEVLQSAKNLENIAREQMALMNKTYSRFQTLYQQGVVSGQERDLVYFKYKAAQQELETAKLNVQLLQKGKDDNIKNSANDVVSQARNSQKLINEIQDDATLKAAAAGTITSMVVHQGEMVNAGYPVMTIQKQNSFFVKFNLRQDYLKTIHTGQQVTLKIPGVTPENLSARVTEIAPALGYADWVPEGQTGDFELRTFQVKVTPVNIQHYKGLKTGMTAQLLLP